jgi:hypothetical protein
LYTLRKQLFMTSFTKTGYRPLSVGIALFLTTTVLAFATGPTVDKTVGASIQVSYNSSNVSSCNSIQAPFGYGNFSPVGNTSGSYNPGPATGSGVQTFTWSCTGNDGNNYPDSASLNVTGGAVTCTTPWGATANQGDFVTAYQSTTGNPDCDSQQTMQCVNHNGVGEFFDGFSTYGFTFTNQTCTPQTVGCMDTNAYDYNPSATAHDQTQCHYDCPTTGWSNCSLTGTVNGVGGGASCANGWGGTCSATCSNGTWTGLVDNCVPNPCSDTPVSWGSCTGNTGAASDGQQVSVSNTNGGFTGSATYQCSNGAFQYISGSCTGGSGTCPTITEPYLTNPYFCSQGSANSPSGDSWNWYWNCDTASCSAQKYGCIMVGNTAYNPSGPPNNYGCPPTCVAGFHWDWPSTSCLRDPQCEATHYNCTYGSASNQTSLGGGSYTWDCTYNSVTVSCSESGGPSSCTLPWGGTIANGASVTAYQASTGNPCITQTRTCTNGVLSGSYTYQTCTNSDVLGCTDPNATNYNPSATLNDGSCTYPAISGCTNPSASNYNPLATIDDGSCIVNGSIWGCTDPSASNYNPSAVFDDGSCVYYVLGCTDPNALNYNPSANVPDGSCLYSNSKPDLTAGSISPTTAVAGTVTTFSSTITNSGATSTGASFYNFIQVATASNGGGTITDLTSVQMGVLLGHASNSTSQSYTFPAAGTYSMRACADKSNRNNLGTITESDENNNCGTWTNITVSPAASASITSNSCTISNNNSSCSATVSWTSSNTLAPRSMQQNGVEFSTSANNAGGTSRTLQYGTTTFAFYHTSTNS